MIPLFKVRMSPDASNLVSGVLQSGFIGQGPQVDIFEKELSKYLGHHAPLTVNSATSGLTLALRLICGEAGGEVLTQPITCAATTWAIRAAGCQPRWVDTSPTDLNMDLADLRRKISEKTKAIVLVHWAGYPNDLKVVRQIQDECLKKFGHFPPVVEDAAHAFGAEYYDSKLGLHGNYVVYSFQAIKHLTCGDGGALLCPTDPEIERGRLLRWYGLDRTRSEAFRCEQDVVEWGYKFHMNDINAIIGRANLPLVTETLAKHRENLAWYRQKLVNVPGIRLLEEASNRKSAAWLMTVRADNRDGLQTKLREAGVMCGKVHERNDRCSCNSEFADDNLPGTDQACKEMLCLPVGWWVTPENREFIADVICKGW